MSKKNQHIDKYLHGKLPDPDIQADAAWEQMNGMLNAAAGAAGAGSSGPLSAVWKKLLGAKSVVLSTAAGIAGLSGIALAVLHFNTETPNPAKKEGVKIENHAPELTSAPVIPETIETPATGIAGYDSSHGKTAGKVAGHEVHDLAARSAAKPKIADPTEKSQAKTSRSAPNINSANLHETTLPPAIRAVTDRAATNREATNRPTTKRNAIKPDLALPAGKTPERSTATQSSIDAFSAENTGTSPENTTNEFRNSRRAATAETERTSQASTSNEAPVNNAINHTPRQNATLLHALNPVKGHFNARNIDLSKGVAIPKPSVKQQAVKLREPLASNIHFGPEWSTTMGSGDKDYLAGGGLDSVNRPLRLLIPGLFVTKTWGRHGLTFTFTANKTYFGNNKIIRQTTDSIPTGDSTIGVNRYNTRLVKATSLAFALHYQYVATRWLSLNAGAGYDVFTGALFRAEMENWQGRFFQGGLTKLKRSGEMSSYIEPQLFTLRAGAIVHPDVNGSRRIQVGCNLMLPLSNVSQDPKHTLKAGNGHVFLRFLIR